MRRALAGSIDRQIGCAAQCGEAWLPSIAKLDDPRARPALAVAQAEARQARVPRDAELEAGPSRDIAVEADLCAGAFPGHCPACRITDLAATFTNRNGGVLGFSISKPLAAGCACLSPDR